MQASYSMLNTSRANHRKAFTLIELMVAITIIAILLVIGLVAGSKVLAIYGSGKSNSAHHQSKPIMSACCAVAGWVQLL